MVAEAEVICQQSLVVNYLCVPSTAPKLEPDFVDVSCTTTVSTVAINSPTLRSPESLESIDFSRSESALSCSTSVQTTTLFENTNKYIPRIFSGSHTDTGPRSYNEDQHIRIDDLSTHLCSQYRWPQPSSFYAVFDGHGGPDAACYLKNNAIKFFFEDAELPQTSDVDENFLHELEISHRRAFLLVDRALADEQSHVDSYCGTTALIAMVLGRYLLVANAGDCRAVLCRKGYALQLSEDHRPSCQVERKRIEDLGGIIKYGYLNGELAVTRALGDWYLKQPFGSSSPLISEPEFKHILLTEDDEFLIIACDGIWDVLSNQEAVSLVRHELRHHNDPQRCAMELIHRALLRDTCDNLTAIVVCLSPKFRDSVPLQRPRLRFCMSEEGRKKLRSLLESN
ncbi:putative protein phosphatase 2C 49-like [Dorcoceras hygrometricum]|uniref:protein-serine/threonine phosphatase n=1 Tax=Dorcoceras hygrometricum TaxID=472368 RepID=A0A2Z7C4Z8_9LAMI|nr:putative protein phosphatase 2C 49-like [Dorcoceras hygrometricum]